MKRLIVMVTGLLLSSAAVMAQGERTPTSVTPTALPGEEKLTARERAERDFLMPARRRQEAALKAAAQAEATAPSPTDISAYHAVAPETKAFESTEAKAPATVHRRSLHRRTTASRHRTSASKKKTVHKSSSGKRKSTSKRSRSRR